MSTRAALKAFFQTGDTPTQAQFEDFIDSVPNITDDFEGYESKFYVTDVVVSGVEQNINVLTVGDNVFCVESCSFLVISVTGSTSALDVINISDTGNIQYSDIISSIAYNFQSSGNEIPIINEDVIINADPLPSGVSALTIRVVIKGHLIPKS